MKLPVWTQGRPGGQARVRYDQRPGHPNTDIGNIVPPEVVRLIFDRLGFTNASAAAAVGIDKETVHRFKLPLCNPRHRGPETALIMRMVESQPDWKSKLSRSQADQAFLYTHANMKLSMAMDLRSPLVWPEEEPSSG